MKISARDYNLALDMQSLKRITKAKDSKLFVLARLLGRNPSCFRQFKSGEAVLREDEFREILNWCDVPDFLLDLQIDPRRGCFEKTQSSALGEFHQRFKAAKSVLTITRAIDSYLVGDDMLQWFNQDILGIDNWNVHQELYMPYVKEQRSARKKSNMIHRLITSPNLWQQAIYKNPDWLLAARDALGEYKKCTAVSIAYNWSQLEALVQGLLPWDCYRWEKLCFVDHEYLLVHMDAQNYYAILNEQTVRTIERSIEVWARLHEPGIPVGTLDELRFQAPSVMESTVEKLLKMVMTATHDRRTKQHGPLHRG